MAYRLRPRTATLSGEVGRPCNCVVATPTGLIGWLVKEIKGMCGRYTLRVSPAELAEIFGGLETIEWSPRYNIAPMQTVAAVRPREQENGRELARLKWGLIPFWAKDAKIASSLINARAETVATKPAFRA